MAFSATEFLPLSSMANSAAPRHWTYQSTDTSATMVASGYFDGVEGVLQVNDIINAVGATGGTQTYTIILVDAITAGVVTVVSSAQVLI